jgi:hypothetical protein
MLIGEEKPRNIRKEDGNYGTDKAGRSFPLLLSVISVFFPYVPVRQDKSG